MNFLRTIMTSSGSLRHSSGDSSLATEQMDDASYYARRSHHSGSWYPSDADELDEMLTKFLADAEDDDSSSAAAAGSGIPNACIAPHAGYRYSGPTAAYAYMALREALLKNSHLRTVVVVSRAHHKMSSYSSQELYFVPYSPVLLICSSTHPIMCFWTAVRYQVR